MKTVKGVTKTTRLGVLLMLGVALAFLFSAVIGCMRNNGPQLTLSPKSGEPGTSVEVMGSGFPADTTVRIFFDGEQIGNVTALNKGDFSTKVIIPTSSVPTGSKAITAKGDTASPFAMFDLQPPGASPSSSSWLDWLGKLWPFGVDDSVYLVVGVVIGILMTLLILNRTQPMGYRDPRETEKELTRVRYELDTSRKQYQRYESLERQVPSLRQQYDQIAAEVRGRFPIEMGASFISLLSVPAAEYGALAEQIKTLKAFSAYLNAEREKARTLKTECLGLANQIKEDDPALFDSLQGVINSAQVEGLKTLRPVLEQMQERAEKTEISPQVKNDLAQLEKSLESIRDYSYRLVPSRLVEFAKDLIKSPASARENSVREQTVRQIITLINEYLRH